MRITVFGATGLTGRHLVDQAHQAGHQVTAVIRSPNPPPSSPPAPANEGSATGFPDGVEVFRADATDPAAIEEAVRHADVVISALGHRPGVDAPICAPGARAIIAAMRATGVRRLLVVTASGHVRDSHDDLATRAFKPILRRFLRPSFEDFAETDDLVTASGLDWTIMRPPRLTNGRPKPYRTESDRTVRRGMTIARADLADAVLTAARTPATIGHAVAVAY